MNIRVILLLLVLFAAGCRSGRPKEQLTHGIVPPLAGDVRSLIEPPPDAPHGLVVEGLSLGLWSEKRKYTLNSRINVWEILSNRNRDDKGRVIPYDESVVYTDKHFLITDPDGVIIRPAEFTAPGEGWSGFGFAGGMSGLLHRYIRRPGTYTIQAKTWKLESNIITIEVEELSAK
jgi:hypothetical protein